MKPLYFSLFTITNEMSVQISDEGEQFTEYLKKLLKAMEYDVPYTANALMEKLNMKSKDSFYKNYLNPARELNLVCRTMPDKPSSRNQRYVKI